MNDDLSSITESRFYDNDLASYMYGGGHGGALGETLPVAPPLHGSDREKSELRKAYQRVLQTQESQVVFVHGTSGQGKTSLVDTLREPVCDTSGYFCVGKFFQDSGIQEPYSAIAAAFSDLCDLVVQSPDFDKDEKHRIGEALALDGHLLSRVINLTTFFSEGDEDSMGLLSDDSGTFARFRAACKSFLLAMASKKHPVLLFLDDVQWMDDGSEKLIDMFVNDREIQNVMFVFSYRDEGASAVEGILQASPSRKGEVVDVQLSDLDFSSVRLMLAPYLRSSPTSDIDELGQLTLQKTGGNPFHVRLFLEVIATEDFLTFNGSCSTFNVEKIRSEIMVAESVADLLYQKICRLSDEVRDVLVVASLLGYSFDQKVLFEVPDIVKLAPNEENTSNCVLREEPIVSSLAHAVDVGFIEEMGEGRYQFTHDKLQAGFQDLVDRPARENFHLLIGKTYLAQNNDSSIYNAAVHLNVAPGFLYCKEQRIKLARINLDASRHCQRLSAFDKAVSLLIRGIDLLDSIGVKWSQGLFGLSLELTESLARMALLVGDFDTCSEATKEAMLHVDTNERKIRIMLINVECKMANNQMAESIKAAKGALSELGVKLPSKPSIRHVAFKVVKLKVLMARKTDEDILGLQPVEDLSVTVGIRLLMHVTLYALMMNEEMTAVYAALHAMDLTLRHGLSTYSAPALALFGIAVLKTGDVDRAYGLGRLALKLLERNPSREADCPTLAFANSLLLHWKEPLSDLRDPLFKAATAGFERGDLIYSTFCISQSQSMGKVAGVNLEVLEESVQAHYRRIKDLGQDELVIWIRPSMQYLANIRSSSSHWRQLALMSEDPMKSNMHLCEANASDNIIVSATALMMKVELSNAFGFHHMARKAIDELECTGQAIHSTYAFTMWCWGAGIANYESFRTDGKRKYLRKARKYKTILMKRDALGPNASTFLRHLQLKESVMRQRRKNHADSVSHDDETLCLLDRELESFSLGGTLSTPCFVVAGAFVDAGSIAERMGRYGASTRYFEQARAIYDEWGAFAPAAWVEEKSEEVQKRSMGNTNVRNELVGDVINIKMSDGQENTKA